jgi:hypothetical protein
MRPSVTEQLEGISHILREVIAPEIKDPYSAGILQGLMASLDSLAVGWKQVPQFLRWDADETARILRNALRHLDQGSADDLRSAFDATPVGTLDMVALEAHHRRMRAALEKAVPAIVEHADLRGPLVDHLRARIGRFPVTTIPIPRPAATGGALAHESR